MSSSKSTIHHQPSLQDINDALCTLAANAYLGVKTNNEEEIDSQSTVNAIYNAVVPHLLPALAYDEDLHMLFIDQHAEYAPSDKQRDRTRLSKDETLGIVSASIAHYAGVTPIKDALQIVHSGLINAAAIHNEICQQYNAEQVTRYQQQLEDNLKFGLQNLPVTIKAGEFVALRPAAVNPAATFASLTQN